MKRVIFLEPSFLRFMSKKGCKFVFFGVRNWTGGEKAGGREGRGGGRTLGLGDRLFGVERVVTVVCGEFGAFKHSLGYGVMRSLPVPV